MITGTLTLDGGVQMVLAGSSPGIPLGELATAAAGLTIATRHGSAVQGLGGSLTGTFNLAPGSILNVPTTAGQRSSGVAGLAITGTLNSAGTINFSGPGYFGSSGAINNLPGGILNANGTGDGDLGGTLNNAGTINIGTPTTIGVFRLNGIFNQSASGALNLKIAGTAAGSFDVLNQFNNPATLGGTLNVSLLNGFHPAATDSFKVITGTLSGHFDTVNGPLTAQYNATDVTLVTPTRMPTITGLNPANGLVGATVLINGTGFTGATAVKFGTTNAATFTVVSATQIRVIVPAGATTGKVSVTTPGGTATSPTNFTLALPPTITSIAPVSGSPGTQVTIIGTNFVGFTAVKFGAVAQPFFFLRSPTIMTANVPLNATTGKISVVAAGGTAISSAIFTVRQPTRSMISGSISSGSAPLPGISGPVPNVPVFLVNTSSPSALAAVLVNPTLLAGSSRLLARTTTNAAGQYSFNALPGTYDVVPALPGVFFSAAYRGVFLGTAPIANVNFSGAGVDNAAPGAPSLSISGDRLSGLASGGASGVLTVVVTLQNSSNQYLNWSALGAPQFTTNALLGSYKIASARAGGALTFNAMRVGAQSWTVSLPANLPQGSYRVTVRSINRAFRPSVPASRVITKGSTSTVVAATAVVPPLRLAETAHTNAAATTSGA